MIAVDTGPLMLIVSPSGAIRTTRLPAAERFTGDPTAEAAISALLGGAPRVIIRRIPAARGGSTRPEIAMWCLYLAELGDGLPVNDPASILARALGWEGPPDAIRGTVAFLGHAAGRLGDVRPEVIHLAGRLILGEPWPDVPAESANRRAAPLEVPAARPPAEAETGPLERLEPEAGRPRGWLGRAYDALASDPLPPRPPEPPADPGGVPVAFD
jgi:hypothetical protein